MKNKKFIIYLVLLVILIAGAYFGYNLLSEKYTPVEIEQNITEIIPAPDFTVYDNDGKQVKFSDFKGKPIVLNFWATWCGPCKTELPAFDAMYEKYGDEVEFLMVNMTDGGRETVDIVKEFMTDSGYGFPVYYDSDLSAAMTYGVSSIPVTAFVDKNGDIVNAYMQAIDETILEKNIKYIMN